MIPLSIVMGKKSNPIEEGPHSVPMHIKERRQWYGIIPLCKECVHHCKQANAPGLTQFICPKFQRKVLTSEQTSNIIGEEAQ